MNQSGFTLVELMVSMGLFTISLLAVLSLFTYGSTQSLRILFTQNSQQAIMEFQEVFDAALSNTTRSYFCGCDNPISATSRRTCTFDAANPVIPLPATATANPDLDVPPLPADQTNWTLFDFEAEYSQTPLDVPLTTELTGAYCQRYTAAAGAMPHYRDRPQQGCKRVYRLKFYNANPASHAPPAVPAPGFLYGGRIQLMVCTGQYKLTVGGNLECESTFPTCSHVLGTPQVPTATCDNGFIRIAEVPGIRSVNCGQERILGDATTEADNFRLDFTYITSVTDNPDLISIQAGNFDRSYSFSAGFRNLVERGIFFGRPSKTTNCSANRMTAAGCAGIAACLDNACCSGTIDFTGGSCAVGQAAPCCISKSSCWPAGHKLHDTNWPQERYTCCSNQAVLKDIAGADRFECL